MGSPRAGPLLERHRARAQELQAAVAKAQVRGVCDPRGARRGAGGPRRRPPGSAWVWLRRGRSWRRSPDRRTPLDGSPSSAPPWTSDGPTGEPRVGPTRRPTTTTSCSSTSGWPTSAVSSPPDWSPETRASSAVRPSTRHPPEGRRPGCPRSRSAAPWPIATSAGWSLTRRKWAWRARRPTSTTPRARPAASRPSSGRPGSTRPTPSWPPGSSRKPLSRVWRPASAN